MEGYISNIIATIVCHPIDVMKTRYQLRCQHKNNGLWNGLSSNLATKPIFWGVYFHLSNDKSSPFESICVANIASLISNPFFVIKVRMQANHKSVSHIEMIKHIYLECGIKGFFKGFISTCVNNIKIGIQLPLFYSLHNEHNFSSLHSSFLSKIITSCFVYPTELIRTIERNEGQRFSDVYKNIYTKHGIKGFYRGMILYNCVSIPQFSIMMFCMEKIFNK